MIGSGCKSNYDERKLKPLQKCLRCRSKHACVVHETGGGFNQESWYVECQDCDLYSFALTEDAAVAEWNKRAKTLKTGGRS